LEKASGNAGFFYVCNLYSLAATAMLAQANQQPQSVLALLKNL